MRAKTFLLSTLVILLVVEQLWLLFPMAKRVVFPPQQAPAEAGRLVAERFRRMESLLNNKRWRFPVPEMLLYIWLRN